MDRDRVTYDRVLLLDLYPNPDYPHVTVVSFKNVGIPVNQLEGMKMTREVRLQPRQLPIYDDDTHLFYIIAKLESDVDRTEEGRATSAVNDFIKEHLRAGIRLVDIPAQVVSNFRGRVQRRVYYLRKSEQGQRHTVAPSKSRRRPIVSSSDPESLLNVQKKQKMDLRCVRKEKNSVTMPPPQTPPSAPRTPREDPPPTVHDHQEVDDDLQAIHEPDTQPLAIYSPPMVEPLQNHSSGDTTKSKPCSSIPTLPSGHSSGPCDKCLGSVLERCNSLNAKIDRTHKKLAQGLRVNVNLLDKVQQDVAEIRRAITALTGTTVATNNQALENVFPLKVVAAVDQYLADDPSTTLALQKCANLNTMSSQTFANCLPSSSYVSGCPRFPSTSRPTPGRCSWLF